MYMASYSFQNEEESSNYERRYDAKTDSESEWDKDSDDSNAGEISSLDDIYSDNSDSELEKDSVEIQQVMIVIIRKYCYENGFKFRTAVMSRFFNKCFLLFQDSSPVKKKVRLVIFIRRPPINYSNFV